VTYSNGIERHCSIKTSMSHIGILKSQNDYELNAVWMISHMMRYRYVNAIKHREGGIEIPNEVFGAGASTKSGYLLL
jgi:hypothetical protein